MGNLLISKVPDCALCGEPKGGVIGVLPYDAQSIDFYLYVCEHCVERAQNICLWHENGSGI